MRLDRDLGLHLVPWIYLVTSSTMMTGVFIRLNIPTTAFYIAIHLATVLGGSMIVWELTAEYRKRRKST